VTQFRTVRKNGKKRVIPIRSGMHRSRSLSPREIEDLTRVGIRHPGSLTSLGYHIMDPAVKKHAALNRAVGKYGRKLGELYRLDYNRPALRSKVVEDIRYVSGGARND